MLKVGVAKVDLTPPPGMRMAGFAGRVFPALAVHDPLWARAAVFDDGERRAGLVTMDLIGILKGATTTVRERLVGSGLAPDALLLAGTHTHSGPVLRDDGTFTEKEKEYWLSVQDRLVSVVNEAVAGLEPARLGAVSGWSAVGINRREVVPGNLVVLGRNHFGKFDTELGLVRIDRTDGTPLAGMMNYACHGVCLMSDNYLTSADYPGYAVHHFEKRVPGAMGLFFQGACGNVNPRETSWQHGYVSGSNFGIAARAGEDIGREAARVWPKARTTDDIRIACASRTISLPTNPARALKAAEQAVADAESAPSRPPAEPNPYMVYYNPPDLERARCHLEEVRQRGDRMVECEIQAISLGPVTFMSWPGEVFCELGMEVKQRSPLPPTYMIGYANDSIGYVPTPDAFTEGGYEARTAARLADNAGLVLVEESVRLLDSLK